MAGVRVRRDVWRLTRESGDPQGWHPDLVWYARAVGELQKRPITDPTSWRYQAAVHGYTDDPRNAPDPLARPREALPSAADQRRFWRKCQHQSWFFLPWHRMYLICFEQLVSSVVKALGGPADWSLPYWNYGAKIAPADPHGDDVRRLPPAFRAATLPGGGLNPLLVPARRHGMNQGDTLAGDLSDPGVRDSIVDASQALRERFFTASDPPGSPGFGGPQTSSHHFGGRNGALEQMPHNLIHVAVGGGLLPNEPPGWMSDPNTAALDPIFWLHHANVDRIWSIWLARDASHANPVVQSWLTSVRFDFHDAARKTVSFTSSQMVNTRASPLGYQYEDESDPLAAAPRLAARHVEGGETEPQAIPEMIGATDRPMELSGRPTTVRLAMVQPTGPARASAAAAGRPRMYMHFENITGERPTTYAVYVNLPEGAAPDEHPERLVGVLALFGIQQASSPTREHAGNGLHFAFDVTDVVEALRANNAWRADEMRVTFLPPAGREQPEALRAAPMHPIRVGRVSVYQV